MRSFLEMISLSGDRHALSPGPPSPARQTTGSFQSAQAVTFCFWNPEVPAHPLQDEGSIMELSPIPVATPYPLDRQPVCTVPMLAHFSGIFCCLQTSAASLLGGSSPSMQQVVPVCTATPLPGPLTW